MTSQQQPPWFSCEYLYKQLRTRLSLKSPQFRTDQLPSSFRRATPPNQDIVRHRLKWNRHLRLQFSVQLNYKVDIFYCISIWVPCRYIPTSLTTFSYLQLQCYIIQRTCPQSYLVLRKATQIYLYYLTVRYVYVEIKCSRH